MYCWVNCGYIGTYKATFYAQDNNTIMVSGSDVSMKGIYD